MSAALWVLAVCAVVRTVRDLRDDWRHARAAAAFRVLPPSAPPTQIATPLDELVSLQLEAMREMRAREKPWGES